MEPFTFVIGAAIAVTVWGVWKHFATKEPLKPEHEEIYKAAVKHVTDPPKLQALADAFDQAKKPVHATALRKLADVHAKKAGKPKPKRTLKRTHEGEKLKLAGQPVQETSTSGTVVLSQSSDQPVSPVGNEDKQEGVALQEGLAQVVAGVER